jgi:FkbM family methyltransferase
MSCFLAALRALDCRVAFDIGANIGVYALLATSLTPSRVVAFEPEPGVAAALAWTVRLNGLAVRVEAKAVGERDGEATLYVSDTTDASNSLSASFRRAQGTIQVPVVTLDRYCQTSGRWPELLKIDTETTEPAVLRGARKVLERRPWILCEVLPGGAADEIEDILGPLGYHWYQIADEASPVARETIAGHERLDASNWLFLPGAAPSGLWDSTVEWRRRIDACGPGSPNRRARRGRVGAG